MNSALRRPTPVHSVASLHAVAQVHAVEGFSSHALLRA